MKDHEKLRQASKLVREVAAENQNDECGELLSEVSKRMYSAAVLYEQRNREFADDPRDDSVDDIRDRLDGLDDVPGAVVAGVRAALSALDGRRPDVETATAELERVLEEVGDDQPD